MSFSNQTNTHRKISLAGAEWKIKDTPIDGSEIFCDGWVSATVSGNIQADLEAEKYIMPLSYGIGDSRLPEVVMRDWRYQKNFNVPTEFAAKRLTLVFDGVDYESEIWLNDQKLGGEFRNVQALPFRRN